MIISKERLYRVLSLTLPIIAGLLSASCLTLVDTYMIGKLGSQPLAAAGMSSFLSFMCFGVVMGISNGVQVIVARRKGENRLDETGEVLNAGLLICLVIGLPLSIVLWLLTPMLYPFFNDDPEVLVHAVPYFQWLLVGTVFVGAKLAFRGYWNGVDRSMVYVITLIIMNVVNVVANLVLIFGYLGFPALGIRGAGIGTLIAQIVGVVIYFIMGFKLTYHQGFMRKLPTIRVIKQLLVLSIPNSIQQVFFSLGISMIFWLVGMVGTDEVAVTTVLINIMLFAVLPAMGLGLGAMTLVGQSLGAKDLSDARRWGWEISQVGAVMLFSIGLPMWIIPDLILGLFVEGDTIALGHLPLQLLGLALVIEGPSFVLMHTLLGAGEMKRVMIATLVSQWVFALPLGYIMGISMGYGLLGIWTSLGVARLGLGLVFIGLWRGYHWTKLQI